MTRCLFTMLALLLLGCDDRAPSAAAEPKPQLSDNFVDSPTDADWQEVIRMADKYEATAPPRKVALTKVQAFMDAYETARESGRGADFVNHVKKTAAQSAGKVVSRKNGEVRADTLLNEAYDVYDRAHPNRVGQYGTNELIDVLALATTYAIEDGDEGAADVLKGSLIHLLSALP